MANVVINIGGGTQPNTQEERQPFTPRQVDWSNIWRLQNQPTPWTPRPAGWNPWAQQQAAQQPWMPMVWKGDPRPSPPPTVDNYNRLIDQRLATLGPDVRASLDTTAEKFREMGYITDPEAFRRLEVGDWVGQDIGLSSEEAHRLSDQATPGIRGLLPSQEREMAANAWLPMIRKQWPGAVAPPADEFGYGPELARQIAGVGPRPEPPEKLERLGQAVSAFRGQLGEEFGQMEALNTWRAAEAAQLKFEEGTGPALTPVQAEALQAGPPVDQRDPIEALVGVALTAGGVVKPALDVAVAPIPEFIKDPVAEAGLGVLSFFGKFAPAAKRGLSVVNFELMKRTSPDWGLTMPWATEEDLEIRRNTFALVREIDVTPAQANQLGTSHWTWTAHPDRLEKALEEVKAGADPLEVAEKHRDNTAEFFGELFIDPLNYAGVVTKPIAKVLRSSIQSAKKFPGISKAFQLTNRSIANVAWADTVDIGRVLTENLDSADDAARAIDNFIANPAKVADNFLPRAKQQSESVAKLLAGVKGKDIVGKTLDSEQAARKMADISYRAVQKATGMAVGGDKHLYNTAQRFLMEHWLGTRLGWVVFNGIDNSAKLAIEGVNPFQRIGLVHDSVIERYGKSFIPTEVIEGGLGKSVQGDGKLLHQKIFGPLAKPMELNFKASGVLESGARLRIFLNKSLGKIRGHRDDMIGLLDDLLGPNVDDITKANIAQDLRSVQYPNEATTKAVFDRYLRKKSPAATMSSFPGDQGFISQEMRDYLGPMFQKAKTPEEVAEIVAKADAGLLEEIAQWGQDVGGPGSPFPATHYAERGGVGAIFEEDGWKLMPQRPDLSHEIVGELAHKVNINPKHAQNALNKIGRELGLETPKGGWTWANLRAASNGEGARLYHNYLVELASTRDVELPSWFTHVDLLEEKMPFLGAEDLSVRPKEAAMLPGIEAEAEIAAGRPQEIADYMREATEQGLGIGPEEIDAAQAAELAGAIPPMAEAPPLAAAPEAPPRITAREELNAILGPQPDFMIPTPAGPPADIGEAALRIGVDPGEADWYAWDKVRQGVMDDIARHSLRTNANDINGLVDRAARMQTEEGWLFGRWGEMRKGVTGAKGRAKIKAAMLPDDMTWAQYYKQNKEAAEAYMDLADELEDILAGGPPPTAGPLAVRTPTEVEGLPIWQRRPEVGEVDVTSILPERLPTAPERVTPLLPAPPAEAVTKQPWQMTKAERVEQFGEVGAQKAIAEGNLQDVGWYRTSYEKMAADGHKAEVKRALAAGQPVPANVLAEYPDLAKAAPAAARVPGVSPELMKKIEKADAGWKIHLSTASPEDVSAQLGKMGLRHKVGRASGQTGKDITVYIGSRDAADNAASRISQELGDLLRPTIGDALVDDIELAPKVMGRFDIGSVDKTMHQYGSRGVPYTKADMTEITYAASPAAREEAQRLALEKADAYLRKTYGEFYTGSAAPAAARVPGEAVEVTARQRVALLDEYAKENIPGKVKIGGSRSIQGRVTELDVTLADGRAVSLTPEDLPNIDTWAAAKTKEYSKKEAQAVLKRAIADHELRAAPPAGVIPGELPAMPPLEVAAPGVTKMEAPAAAARGDVLLGRGTEQLRKAQVEEMGRGAQIGMFGEIEEVTTPAMMRNQMVRLRDEIDILTKQATSPKIAGRMKAFLQKHIDTKTAEIEDIARRLVTEETGAFRPADIVAPISDELGKWKAHVTGNLGRADEVIDQSPEAMRAIRRARDEAIKMTKASIGEAQIYGLKETNRVLGDYLRKGNLVDLASNFIPFAHWPAYNLPYWGWTFMERPHIPAAMAKARTAQAMQNRDMPDRLRYTVPIPGSERWMESLGFPAGNALRFDPWRALSFMQSMPGGTPYQSQQLREVMDDPTSPQSVMTIGSQMGVRPWPWVENVLGYKGLMGDDWYPYDLSSFEPLARALFDTDATPSSWLREKLGMEPNRFLDYQMEKEVRGQIMRGETEDWEKARTTARQKAALYAVVGMTTGFYPKEFTAEEDERLGMTEALRQAVAQDVRDTGGDPDLMGIGEQWDWAKRHGSTMTDVSSNINKFYEANPEYRDIQQTWMSEEERNVDEQTSAYYDESSAVAEKRDAALAALPIPHPDEDESAAWDEWATEDAAVREKYPLANLTPSSARPIEVLQDRTSAALLRQLKDTRPWYDQEKYDSYYEYTQALKDWEANIRNNARGLWGPEVFMRHQSLASLEAIDEYTKARHSITGAADYVYKKHIESPYWEAGKKAQVTQLEGLADWENVREPIAQWQEYVDMAAEVSGIDPRIIGAIIEVESGGDADAYNKRSQATGLMQVMPGEVFDGRPLSDELKDPKANIDTGTAILQGYLDDTSWDLKQALYQYSGGAAWSSFESYEKNYWDRLSTKFKGLWGVSLGGLRADASDKIMARAEDVDADVIVSLIQMEYPGRWTDAELRAELEGKEIRGVQEAYAIEQPASAAERSAGDDVWDMRASLPPGVYRSALDDLAEVSSFLSTGENPGAALEAIEVYVDEHPITGNAQEWAQAEREHDQFRRYVYNTWGAAIYEEQNAYYEAKAAGRYPEPSERLEAYWDAHTQFRQEHPLYTRFYFPDWQPYEGKKAAAPRAARQPTKQEVLQETSTAWKDFADTFEDKALLELIQSYLVMSASQRGWFLSRNPELRAWLQAQDPKWLGELKASLESSLPRPRTSYATQRAPSLRWYRSSW